MNANTILPPHFNLTGQVTIQNIPDFMGNYSLVYRGIVHGNLVAVKIIKPTCEPESMKRKVLRERVVWGSTNHPNIHPFYGYADDPAFGPFGALISPWSARGDASRFLKENGQRMIMAERTDLWKGVIEGVLYLHDQTPPIGHGDLKPGNVLINEFGVPRICDFGLARIFLEQGSTGLTTTSEHTGTARYLAPELVASDTPVYPTLASDVYALGCLGLDFIYLQQPFSNHPNNLRGQIFRDLRRGLPPAIERPPQAWPSIRVWPIISQCWGSDPHSRPLAFTVTHMLRHTVLTVPAVVIKRIAYFVDTAWEYGYRPAIFRSTWEDRCQCLRHLCLVSRACRECATPFLYRKIRLNLQNPRCLFALISTLDSTTKKLLFSPQEPSGYGACTKFISLDIRQNAIRESDLAVGIRNLIVRLPGLRLVQIYDNITTPPAMEPPLLTTLALVGVDLSIIFDHRLSLQVLESLQCLRLTLCFDSASSSGPLREALPTVCLPNLLEIYFFVIFFDSNTMPVRPLATISTWIMPRLRYLNFLEPRTILPSGFFTLLQTHGPKLQSLVLTSMHIRGQDIFNLLTLCTDLRLLEIEEGDSLFALSASHARLEKIKVKHPGANSALETAVHTLKRFKLEAESSFPKLIEVELTVRAIASRPAMGSFRTADTFITFRDGDKTYRLFDGQADLVGAYFGQGVDCADFVAFGYINSLEVSRLMTGMEE